MLIFESRYIAFGKFERQEAGIGRIARCNANTYTRGT
jgi:hypothetical protein